MILFGTICCNVMFSIVVIQVDTVKGVKVISEMGLFCQTLQNINKRCHTYSAGTTNRRKEKNRREIIHVI